MFSGNLKTMRTEGEMIPKFLLKEVILKTTVRVFAKHGNKQLTRTHGLFVWKFWFSKG